MSIVVNSTPLISLALLDQLDLLKMIFGEVIVPCAVYDEVVTRGADKTGYKNLSAVQWFCIEEVINQALKQSIMIELDEGEAEVICIAKEKGIKRVCIDEFAGRKYAKLLGLDVIGTLGVLLIAKEKGYIQKIKPCIDKLIANNRHIGASVYNEVLRKAGEL